MDQEANINVLSLETEDEDIYNRNETDQSKNSKLTNQRARKTSSRPGRHILTPPERTSELDIHLDVYQSRDLGVRPYQRGRERRDYDHDAHGPKARKRGRYNDKYQRDKSEKRYGHHRYFDHHYDSKKYKSHAKK